MEGRCVCIFEPRGSNGLEGFSLGREYDFQLMQKENKKKYYRVFPSDIYSTYYEVCKPKTFKKYFKILNNISIN